MRLYIAIGGEALHYIVRVRLYIAIGGEALHDIVGVVRRKSTQNINLVDYIMSCLDFTVCILIRCDN